MRTVGWVLVIQLHHRPPLPSGSTVGVVGEMERLEREVADNVRRRGGRELTSGKQYLPLGMGRCRLAIVTLELDPALGP